MKESKGGVSISEKYRVAVLIIDRFIYIVLVARKYNAKKMY